MKTSNNFQNVLPASFELSHIISTDFSSFSKEKNKFKNISVYEKKQKKLLFAPFFTKYKHMLAYFGRCKGYRLTHMSVVTSRQI